MHKQMLFIFLLFIPIASFAQYYEEIPPTHYNEYGAGITVAMSGFGIGGYYRFALPNMFFIGADVDFYMMRDEKQITYYDYYTGYPIELNSPNRLFLIPFDVELKKRLFASDIEDNFRPYIAGMGGFTFGMNFPRDTNDPRYQNLPRDNQYRLTFNFALGVGIDVNTSEDFYISIRPQYRFMYFAEAIAGKKNHSNFEIRLELGKRLSGKN